jgi:Uma2 family endonuclease
MMSTTSALMTVEQFRALPEPREGTSELHHGVPVIMPPPKHKHFATERRLVKLLEPAAAGRGLIWTEIAFRPLPEHECWVADVAFISQARYNAIDPEDNLRGVPELVIEVLSPSNTVSEIGEKEAMCLENGCLEFWVVDPKRKTVKVSTPDRKTITYVEGDQIRLSVPAAGELAVSEIFSSS